MSGLVTMPEIAEPLRATRILARPKKFAPLKGFSCGRQGNQWEKVVNDWARAVYLGTYVEQQTVVALEDAHSRLIGVAGFMPKPLPGSKAPTGRIGAFVACPQYIQMIGIDRLYHRQRLQDGSRLGDVLLRGTLEQIQRTSDARVPQVWALVTPENERARALFARNGFSELPYTGDGEISYVRSRSGAPPLASVRLARWVGGIRKRSRTPGESRSAGN